jgi:hypothetical protein
VKAKIAAILLAFAALVAVLLAATSRGAGSSAKESDAEGVDKVAFRTSLAGFALVNRVIHLAEIRRGEGDTFTLALEDESLCRFGRVAPEIELRRQGETLLASLVEKRAFILS